jgi:rhamnose utilization protein RhaD (predicted bifunctional aldolase and dehydrogenase)
MYDKEKNCMKVISQYCGKRLDYVQVGGGNTSYKFDDKIMAIKASGYSLAEVTQDSGYMTVDYSKIIKDYAALSENSDCDVEVETLKINMNSVSLLEGMKNLRPSVEVGFHSYLKRAVVHTHSVYSNLLCCSDQGRDLAQKIFENSELGYIYIPFINPGFRLSMRIKDECHAFQAKNGKMPELVFMESHGIIASDDNYETAMDIHEKANDMIRDYFKTRAFPTPVMEKTNEGYISKMPLVSEFIQNFGADTAYFEKTLLYPDQMVYQGNNLGKTILIDSKSGQITFKMSENQAKTTFEVMFAVMYIISEIKRLGLDLKLLCDEGVVFIRDWESEKYRAELVK